MAKELDKKDRNITDSVLARYNQTVKAAAIDVPSDYSADNALKSAWFELQTVENASKKSALDVCTQDSIANSLYEMVVNGLNPMKKQCYFIVYGNKLTCQTSYQGNIAMAKRFSGIKSVKAREIYEKDKFITKILTDGREVLVSHDQPFENTDGKIIGGYCIIIDNEEKEHLTKMTIGKIKKSWDMGKANGKSKFHTNFDDEAVKRTVINRACKPYVNSSNDESIINEEQQDKPIETLEITANEEIEINALEIKEPEQKQPEAKEEPNEDNPY